MRNYNGVVDSPDCISILSVNEFVNNARRLYRVIFDYSQSKGTNISEDDLRQINMLLNLESNFTENFFAVVIPKDKYVREEFYMLKAIMKNGYLKLQKIIVRLESYCRIISICLISL